MSALISVIFAIILLKLLFALHVIKSFNMIMMFGIHVALATSNSPTRKV